MFLTNNKEQKAWTSISFCSLNNQLIKFVEKRMLFFRSFYLAVERKQKKFLFHFPFHIFLSPSLFPFPILRSWHLSFSIFFPLKGNMMNELKKKRLSHDVVTRNVDHDVSPAYCILLVFFRRWGRLVMGDLIKHGALLWMVVLFCFFFNSSDWRISILAVYLSDLLPRRSAVARISCCCVFWSWASTLLELLFHYPCWCSQGEVLYELPLWPCVCRNQNSWQMFFLLGDERGFCYETSGALVKALNNTAFYWLRV